MWNNFVDYYGDVMAFYPNATALLKKLDSNFLEFIKEYEVNEVKIPSLISEDVLRKCGYFETFPQHLTELTPYGGAVPNSTRRYLTPAACIHIYPMLKNNCKLESCYTTVERVYRYESGNFQNDERLWEFTVREIVFVGSEGYVKSALSDMGNKALHFAKQIDEQAVLKTAHDSFIPTKANLIRERLQIANHMKDELLMPYDNRQIAVASFNYHGTHFSKPFGFDKHGAVVTGCVGFGLERWMLCVGEKK